MVEAALPLLVLHPLPRRHPYRAAVEVDAAATDVLRILGDDVVADAVEQRREASVDELGRHRDVAEDEAQPEVLAPQSVPLPAKAVLHLLLLLLLFLVLGLQLRRCRLSVRLFGEDSSEEHTSELQSPDHLG